MRQPGRPTLPAYVVMGPITTFLASVAVGPITTDRSPSARVSGLASHPDRPTSMILKDFPYPLWKILQDHGRRGCGGGFGSGVPCLGNSAPMITPTGRPAPR